MILNTSSIRALLGWKRGSVFSENQRLLVIVNGIVMLALVALLI